MKPKSRPPYPAEFRKQMIELVRSGRTPAELAREFPCMAQTIANRVTQGARDKGKKGLTTAEREELSQLRRQVKQLQIERDILSKATAWFAGRAEKISAPSSSS